MAANPEHPNGINAINVINSIFPESFSCGKNLCVSPESRTNKYSQIPPVQKISKQNAVNAVNSVNAVNDRYRDSLAVSAALLAVEPVRPRSSGLGARRRGRR
jgi:hypothetical protein